ncbi:hypothetical protein [Thalassomonas sp. RHCl1]|uniref:hypothetical protein n=1 Tax=Thalassomonas sp. RHCl1 TaxID=2995320 RepID=UPI00248C48F8|nr:hypothetical protein [Thalassomonas sp. RHCl1]
MNNKFKKVILALGVAVGVAAGNISAQPADCNVCFERLIACESGELSGSICGVWLNACFAACVPD